MNHNAPRGHLNYAGTRWHEDMHPLRSDYISTVATIHLEQVPSAFGFNRCCCAVDIGCLGGNNTRLLCHSCLRGVDNSCNQLRRAGSWCRDLILNRRIERDSRSAGRVTSATGVVPCGGVSSAVCPCAGCGCEEGCLRSCNAAVAGAAVGSWRPEAWAMHSTCTGGRQWVQQARKVGAGQ